MRDVGLNRTIEPPMNERDRSQNGERVPLGDIPVKSSAHVRWCCDRFQ